MNSFCYYNGKFARRDMIKIPLSDRAIFFGDAVYDAAIGSYDRILWEDEHIDRFFNNASRLGIKHNYTKTHLSSLLREIGVRSMLESYFIYFQLSRDSKERVHSGHNCDTSNLLITVDSIDIPESPKPLKLITTKDKRYGYCDIKTINLLPAVISATEAEKQGCDEAIFVRDGFVTECTKSNISILKRGRLITHPKCNLILPGIAREHLIGCCRSLGIAVTERPFTVFEMMNADEIMVTSTTKLARATESIDGTTVGGRAVSLWHKIYSSLYSEYRNFCKK